MADIGQRSSQRVTTRQAADRIRLRFADGVQAQLTTAGALSIQNAGGELLQRKPSLYQTARDGSVTPVEGRYRLAPDGAIGFSVANYDRSLPLTTDPVLESATLLGGSGDDRVFFADPTMGVVGSTASLDFPGGPTGPRGGSDIFIYQQSTESTTIFGGSGDDIVTCVSPSSDGRTLLIGGYTNSHDLPMIGFAPSSKTYATPVWGRCLGRLPADDHMGPVLFDVPRRIGRRPRFERRWYSRPLGPVGRRGIHHIDRFPPGRRLALFHDCLFTFTLDTPPSKRGEIFSRLLLATLPSNSIQFPPTTQF